MKKTQTQSFVSKPEYVCAQTESLSMTLGQVQPKRKKIDTLGEERELPS